MNYLIRPATVHRDTKQGTTARRTFSPMSLMKRLDQLTNNNAQFRLRIAVNLYNLYLRKYCKFVLAMHVEA
jgi:hypothetical protein